MEIDKYINLFKRNSFPTIPAHPECHVPACMASGYCNAASLIQHGVTTGDLNSVVGAQRMTECPKLSAVCTEFQEELQIANAHVDEFNKDYMRLMSIADEPGESDEQ